MSHSVVYSAIRKSIASYQENAYFNIREADYCSDIFSAIRSNLMLPDVRIASLYTFIKGKMVAVTALQNIFTSRVHQEASFLWKAGGNQWQDLGKAGCVDIVVLVEDKVDLRVSAKNKPYDTQAQYLVSQVKSAIEVKCTPLNSGDIVKKDKSGTVSGGVVADLLKLGGFG